jgi:putative molybdopterin biosynthesis protein
MSRLAPVVAWVLQDEDGAVRIDARVLPLLRAIAPGGSLAAAARACGVPYRTAWAAFEEAERLLGAPLVTLTRGRGASPTPLALRWLAADNEASKALDSALGFDLHPGAAHAELGRMQLLRVAASHDIALAQLKDRWRLAHAIALEFHGSGESIEAYRSGRVEIAGFHVATTARGESDPLLARLEPDRDAVFRFLTREQGLIVPGGNPRRLRGFGDLAAKRLTIVNRQPGSGTRLLFDRLLARAGIAGESLSGYSNEEFTHAAIAATVAAGRADTGFGIRAAASQFGLGFVPVVNEHYLFACARKSLENPRIVAFRALLASRATRAVVAPLPGYSLDAPGRLRTLRRS